VEIVADDLHHFLLCCAFKCKNLYLESSDSLFGNRREILKEFKVDEYIDFFSKRNLLIHFLDYNKQYYAINNSWVNKIIIKNIEVKNFRSIKEAYLECDDLTVLIGGNGAGKSSFLYAIKNFYDIIAPITDEDFFNRDINDTIEIRVTYGNLRDDEKEEFKSYIKDNKLIVTKRISYINGKTEQKYYAAPPQIPQFAKIRAKPKKEMIKDWNELIESKLFEGLEEKARSSDNVKEFMIKYEEDHPELLEPIKQEVQFFGPPNIGGGKLDNFTKFVLVPAVREASDEVSHKKGAIYQILDMIILRKVNAREDIQKFKSEFEQRIKKLYSSENLTELPELGNSISTTLEKFAPGSHLNLNWSEIKIPMIPLPAPKASLIEDGFEGEITRKGHGLQRALIITLLQHLAMTVPITTSNDSSIEKDKIETRELSKGPDLIIAIEEPELYLHPARCRYLSNILYQLIKKPEYGLGASNQIIYTSHSPYFVDLDRFDKIRVVKKVLLSTSPIQQSVVTNFSLEQAKNELANVCNANPNDFTRESFKAHAMPIMNAMVNEGFFADVVVVVEGPSDVGILWKLQEIKQKNWSKLGIVVIPAYGKNNIDRPVIIFRGFKIPTYFVFDADSQHKGKGTKKTRDTKIRNHRYLKLAGVSNDDFPDTQVYETWAVFKEDIEGIFKEALGDDTFQEIQEIVASELGYDDGRSACKNIEGAARFIELVYERGHQIPILENIIEKVTQLYESS